MSALGQKRKGSNRAFHVRFAPDSDQIADIAEGPSCANIGHATRCVERLLESLLSRPRNRPDIGHACPAAVLSPPMRAPFSATERFISRTSGTRRKHDHGEHPKAVEIDKGRRLLLTQIVEGLQGELLRGDRIAGLFKEHRACLVNERLYGRVKGVEILTKPKTVELAHGGRCRAWLSDVPTLPPSLRRKFQQADRGPAHSFGM